MGSIIFLRHGQAKNNTERILAGRTKGVSLTEEGMIQAQNIAKFLKPMDISHVYSSPIERAYNTAKIVAEHNSSKVTIDDRLIELDMGKFTGMRYDDIFSLHGNIFMKFYGGSTEIEYNGVETFEQVKKRVSTIVQQVISDHNNENVVLVTHMDPIKAILSLVLELSPKSLQELIIANASLTIFDEYDGNLSLKGINVMDLTRFKKNW